jgi:hypothetical protein
MKAKSITSGLLGLTVAGAVTLGVIDGVTAGAADQSSPRPSATASAPSVHDGPWLGSFKRRDPATSPETTVLTMRKEGDGIRYVIDVTRPDGPSRQMGAFVRFDGKPYPETGNPTADYNVFERVDARTLHLVDLKDGKETARFRITYSADGRVRTSVSTRPGPDGRPVSSTAIWDRID